MIMERHFSGLVGAFETARKFHAMGTGRYWYLKFHYRGRAADRLKWESADEVVALDYRGQRLRFQITPVYGGALQGVFLDDEYALEGQLNGAPKRILDLGANAGMAASALAAQFPSAEFVLVEPDPRNIARLERAVEWNGLKGEILPVAVAEAPGRLALRFGSNPTCSALETSAMHDLSQSTMVDVMTPGAILDHAGWDMVDLVKVDIEGLEEQVICDSAAWLHRAGAVIVEIHPSCDEKRIAGVLSDAGLRMRRHGSGREPVYLATRH